MAAADDGGVSACMSDTTDVNPAARRAAVGARRPFYRRRKSCPFSGPNAPKIDYKDVRLLSRFLSRARQDRAVAASPRSPPRSSASWRRRSSAPASWRCCPTS